MQVDHYAIDAQERVTGRPFLVLGDRVVVDGAIWEVTVVGDETWVKIHRETSPFTGEDRVIDPRSPGIYRMHDEHNVFTMMDKNGDRMTGTYYGDGLPGQRVNVDG